MLLDNIWPILLSMEEGPNFNAYQKGTFLTGASNERTVPMFKRLTATALAASIALTSAFVAPARAADTGEIARGLLGAGVLLYLGNELSKNNRSYTTRRYVEPRHVQPRYDHDHPRQRVKRNRKVVPASCLRTNDYRNGPRRYFASQCLSKNMRNAGRLPGQCRTEVQTRRGWRNVYGAYCLRQFGWTFG